MSHEVSQNYNEDFKTDSLEGSDIEKLYRSKNSEASKLKLNGSIDLINMNIENI